MKTRPSPSDALLLIASGCAHCPAVLEGFAQLLKQAAIGRLEVVNIDSHPELAAELGVRSVPWFRIGEFELQGSYSPTELKDWAARAAQPDGAGLYLAELLSTGQLDRAIGLIRRHPHWLSQAIELLTDADTGMSIKTGLGALIEEFTGSEILIGQITRLALLLKNDNHGIRSDACYFLALSQSPLALPYLQQALEDSHAEVQEIARESLEELAELGIH